MANLKDNTELLLDLWSQPFIQLVQDFLPSQETICIHHRATLEQCLRVMDQANLRCCMVCTLQETEECSKDSPRLGTARCLQIHLPRCHERPNDDLIRQRFKMLDMRDVLKYLVIQGQEIFDRFHFASLPSPNGTTHDTVPVVPREGDVSHEECTELLRSVLACKAGDIANVSEKNKYIPGWIDESLSGIAQALGVCPRNPIFSWDREAQILTLYRIFSASDLFLLFQDSSFVPRINQPSLHAFRDVLNQPVGQFWCPDQDIDTSFDTDPLVETLQRLVITGLKAFPIVDITSPRKVLGVISVRDFKQMFLRVEQAKSILCSSTLSYVGRVRQIECLKAKFPSISVNHQTPVHVGAQRLLAADIQRIFVVDDGSQIIGMFSRTDLGRLIARTVISV